MNKQHYFLTVFKAAEKKYGRSSKRLAGDAWPQDWQTVIATLMSAQTRDEVTIPVAENLFKRYPTLKQLAHANVKDVRAIIKPVNFSPRKAEYVVGSARMLLEKYGGKVPDTIEQLVELPGVGRKTANLSLSEIHQKDGICVDTHVHRICNVFGFVTTKTPEQTERALMKFVPQRYWSRINRTFVLWGKDVRGREKSRFLKALSV